MRLQVVIPIQPATQRALAALGPLDKALSSQCDVRLSIRNAGWLKEKVAGTQVGLPAGQTAACGPAALSRIGACPAPRAQHQAAQTR